MPMLGPYKSASKTPTSLPARAAAIARFAVTVDLPTPPFRLATAIIFFTSFKDILFQTKDSKFHHTSPFSFTIAKLLRKVRVWQIHLI
jgi:hypothetical protein